MGSIQQRLPLSARNLTICSSHCHFVAVPGPTLCVGDVHQVVNDRGHARRVKIVMIQESGPEHQRSAFVLAKLLDLDELPRPPEPARRTSNRMRASPPSMRPDAASFTRPDSRPEATEGRTQ